MNLFYAFILGIVEGITEFLPVSSTGHLILVSTFLKIPQTEYLKTFEIIIQLGAIAAVASLYTKKILNNRTLIPILLAAFVPTAIIGYLLYKSVKQYLLGNPFITVIALAVGGILFMLIEQLLKRNKKEIPLDMLTIPKAFIIGLGQSLSIIPGVSRAAASIFTGMLTGLSRSAAVEFSFLLAIPTMIAASMLDIIKSNPTISHETVLPLFIGFITAYITALFVVKLFITFIQKKSFTGFALYRIVLAVTFWWFLLK